MRKLAVALFAAALAMMLDPFVVAGVAAADTPAPITNQQSWLRLDVDSVNPPVIESGSGPITVTATITNISTRTISDLVGQLRIGVAANSEQAVAAGIAGEVVPNSGTPFRNLLDHLDPGQHEKIAMTVPVSGPGGLAVSKPGVYPMLINIDGVPDYGKQARLATDAVLLPVRSVPGNTAPNPGGTRQLTVLWPLVDTAPSAFSETSSGQPVLTDDHLATSLAGGGRLANLLDAARHAPASASPTLCYAIDPELLDTVLAMSHGYQVRTSGGGTTPGTGATAAAQWLGTLRGVVGVHCVLPLPFADADLAALSRSGALDLERLAITQEADLAADLKPASIQQLNNVLWPLGNTVDQHTMTDLAGLGQTTALVEPDALTPTSGSGVVGLTGVSTVTPTRAVVVDQLISDALDGSADHSTVAGAPSVPSSQSVLNTENGIGALLYQSVFGNARNQPMLIAPPRRWDASADELEGFLNTVGSVVDGEHATATGLATLVGQQPSSGAATLTSSPAASAEELPIALTSTIVAQDQTQQDVLHALHADPTNPSHFQPSALIAPLQLDLLRCASGAWRGNSGGADATDTASGQLALLTNSVSIEAPPASISRASGNSPLSATVSNKLPVDVAVQVTFSGDPGLEPPAPYNARIPANSQLTLFIPAKFARTGRFSLIETLTTPTGDTVLGPPARLELLSTSYGTIILVVSGVAFGAVVLLSARRIYRRARSNKQEQLAPPAPEQEPSNRS
ncbi:MAG TPA: hypothetical protein VHZ97_22250 [Pseudonocardiaceae bacterium]|nr:hypothetical protein [Pseudonocardiaceae bacterium]